MGDHQAQVKGAAILMGTKGWRTAQLLPLARIPASRHSRPLVHRPLQVAGPPDSGRPHRGWGVASQTCDRSAREAQGMQAPPSIEPDQTLSGPRQSISRGRRSQRGWLGAVSVVIVLGLVGFGGYAVDVPLSELTAAPVTLGGSVRIEPLSGWKIASRSQNRGVQELALSRGGGRLQVLAGTFRGEAEQLLAAYVRGVLAPATSRLAVSGTIQHVRLASGLTGSRISYLGTGQGGGPTIEGQVTAVVSPGGIGVAFDAFASQGLFPFVLGDVDHMIVSAEVS
jgi:hypothetical protein